MNRVCPNYYMSIMLPGVPRPGTQWAVGDGLLGELMDSSGLSSPNGQTWVVLVQAGDLLAPCAMSSSTWIRPAQKETNEMLGDASGVVVVGMHAPGAEPA
jgi:hypothetical protein